MIRVWFLDYTQEKKLIKKGEGMFIKKITFIILIISGTLYVEVSAKSKEIRLDLDTKIKQLKIQKESWTWLKILY